MQRLIEYIKMIKPKVDSYISKVLEGEPAKLYEAARHLPLKGGKRLRPALLILVARALGGEEEEAIPAAASVELLHNFTLVHDDIMDRDEMRRGVPTVHVLYGEPLAILAGDLLYAKAYEALLSTQKAPELVKKMTEYLTWAGVTVAEGQAMDMMFEERWDVSEDEYLEMIAKKTGALFGACGAIGALVAEKPEYAEKMREFGVILGKAFQIKDDILSLVGDEKVTGKPKYNDLREGKRTLLVIRALRSLPPEEAEELKRILSKEEKSLEELEKAASLIMKSKALDYALKVAEELENRAREILSEIEVVDKEAMDLINELLDFAVKREF